MPTVLDPGYRIQPLMPMTEVNGFNGLAFDSQDNPYGGVVHDLPIDLFVPEGFLPAVTLTGVAISKAGNIYVTSDIENVIYKISPNRK